MFAQASAFRLRGDLDAFDAGLALADGFVVLDFFERVEHDTIYFGNKEFSHVFSVNDLAADKCFWQALAKSFNWRRRFIVISCGIGGVPESGAVEQWEHEARRFFSLLVKGGDTDAFWQKHLRRWVA